jgi:hypothetical protein
MPKALEIKLNGEPYVLEEGNTYVFKVLSSQCCEESLYKIREALTDRGIEAIFVCCENLSDMQLGNKELLKRLKRRGVYAR